MRRPTRSLAKQPAEAFLLAPEHGSRHYRWVVLAVAVVLIATVVLIIRWVGATAHPLPPIGAVILSISALAAMLAGTGVGLAAVLAGVVLSFVFLADFSSARGVANAVVSASVWCAATLAAGIVSGHLRRQVARRETALEQALSRSMTAKDMLERALELGPRLLQDETVAQVSDTACESAMSIFNVDSVRVFSLKGKRMRLVAICPPSDLIKPGYEMAATDFPDLEIMMARRRPLFVRDIGDTRPVGAADELRRALGLVSTVRLPIVGPGGPVGVLSLGWGRAIDKPADELLAVMQRYADQVAIAWHNALRLEAQKRADSLHKTLERVVKLAPTFHISGTREAEARAICRAALTTFECSGAALYRVEGDRLRLLERLPVIESLPPGRTFPLTSDMPLLREMRSPRPTFVADVWESSRSIKPWPQEVVKMAGTRSALYVPMRFEAHVPANLLVLSWKRPREVPDDGFRIVVQRFADQAALALAHSSAERLHARLEASLLPTAPIEHPLFEVVTRYKTGEQRLHLGGDFLGSTVIDDVLSFVLGDVSGHGPDAAAMGASLRSTWKALTLAGQSLPGMAGVMGSLILQERSAPNAFATILVGTIDARTRTLTWINAGHLPPLLLTDRVTSLGSQPIPPLGVRTDFDRTAHRIPLPENWSLFCYTDGLVDARLSPGASERYGEERLKERLQAWTFARPNGVEVERLMDEIETGSGGRFADDVAILLISAKQVAERTPLS